MDIEARLSPPQREFLCWLLEQTDSREWWPDRQVKLWRLPKGTSRSTSAARSRMLRRMEDRGLIERHNDFEDSERTTRVVLTAAGRTIAEQLTAATEKS